MTTEYSLHPEVGGYEERASPGARVLLYSQRNLELSPWLVGQFEFEDVISAVDRVRLLAPGRAQPRHAGHRFARMVQNRMRLAGGGWRVPALDPVQVDGEYDLFFACFHFAHQLPQLEQLRGWRERCRTAVCFVVELWTSYIRQYERYLPLLDQFDHVFILNRGSIEVLSRHTSAPVSFLATGVDAERFAPVPLRPERVIDFYNFGRRSPVTHAALLRLVEQEGRTYVYDSLKGAMMDFREHRQLVANMMKRSRYFFAYRINDSAERQERTQGEEGLSTRYFEATAGGAVLLGSRPRCSEYDECFDWPDATIEIPYEADDIGDIVAELEAQPARLAAARRNNVTNALRRHDWLYRWQQVLAVAGLGATPAMAARADRLERLARMASGDAFAADGLPVANRA